MLKKNLQAVMLAAMTVGAAGVSATPMMIVGTGNGGAITDLYEVDAGTGAVVSYIGSVGFALNDMAWDATTGTLYGSTSLRDPSGYNGLVTIDLGTGAGSNTGFVDGWGFDKGLFGGANYPNVGLTANSSGALYGLDEIGADGLSSVDKTDGTVTEVGNAFGVCCDGLAFDASDTLYHIQTGSIGTVDPVTGARTAVASYSNILDDDLINGEFNPLDGLYYGAERQGDEIGILNLATGAMSSLSTTLTDVHIVVFVDDMDVPEPVTLSLLAAGLLGAGAMRRKSRT